VVGAKIPETAQRNRLVLTHYCHQRKVFSVAASTGRWNCETRISGKSRVW